MDEFIGLAVSILSGVIVSLVTLWRKTPAKAACSRYANFGSVSDRKVGAS